MSIRRVLRVIAAHILFAYLGAASVSLAVVLGTAIGTWLEPLWRNGSGY